MTVRRWTPTATDCYRRGCICKGCFFSDFFKNSPDKCQMKNTVLELVRCLGTPEQNTDFKCKPRILAHQEQLAYEEMEKLGEFTIEDIAKKLNTSKASAKSCLSRVKRKAKLNISETQVRRGRYWINKYKLLSFLKRGA